MAFTWIANDQGDITGVTAGTGITVTSPTGPVPTVAIDTAVTVDKTTAQTLTNKTLTSPALTTPTISTATTNGDILYGTGSGALARLGIGSSAQVLTVAGGIPSWATPAAGASFVGCSLYTTGSQTISNATFTAVLFDSESFDTDTFHSTASNTSRVTIPSGKGGKYALSGTVSCDGAASGVRAMAIYQNGSPVKYVSQALGAGAGAASRLSFALTLSLVATDYVELYFYQESGGSLGLDVGITRTSFYATYLGA